MKVFHVIIDTKPQYEINQIIEAPFRTKRSYTHWKAHKQQAESELEKIRTEKFPHMPSRDDCLFVARDIEMINSWIRSKYRNGGTYYLYEFEIIDGIPVYLDTDWFEGLAELLSEGAIIVTHKYTKEECMQNYWSGKVFRPNGGSLLEGLFYGRAQVICKKKFEYNRMLNTIKEIV